MKLQSTTLGDLSCEVVDALPAGRRPPQWIVVLCHGYGAPGTDLVPLAREVLGHRPALADAVQFVFPAGPFALDQFGLFGGRAWWHVNVQELADAIQRGVLRRQTRDLSAGLTESRQLLTALVGELSAQTGVPISHIMLGGFSQGAVLATDVALRLPETAAALCIFSGTLVCEPIWRDLAKRHLELPVLQSHGLLDPLLPRAGAVWLRDLLVQCGLSVDYFEFAGGHTIPLEAIQKLAELLDRLAH